MIVSVCVYAEIILTVNKRFMNNIYTSEADVSEETSSAHPATSAPIGTSVDWRWAGHVMIHLHQVKLFSDQC